MSRFDGRDGEARRGRWRLPFVGALLALAAVALLARAVYLQVIDQGFLERKGDARFTRTAKLSANRGMILDRNGLPLAVSTPVDTVKANPAVLIESVQALPRLAQALGRDPQWLKRRISSNLQREGIYLVRHMPPPEAERVRALGVPGLSLEREYRRYYPAGEVAGHLLGFTDIDDIGQEGLELAFDQWLGGVPGLKRIIQDRLGRSVEDIEQVRAPRPGQDLYASIDLRIQYLAYRELKAAVTANKARGGSMVVVDVATGEVLAVAVLPSFNPNDREQYVPRRYRNVAAIDILEPGSSIKPFIVAAAMQKSGLHANSPVDTSPGSLRVGVKTIQDKHNLGLIDLQTVLAKSSNVGVVKVGLALTPQELWTAFDRFGFGKVTGSGFPAEAAGVLEPHEDWSRIGQATMCYGYGLSVSPLQLAQAYAILGSGGLRRPVSLKRLDTAPAGERVLDEKVARELVAMLEKVVSDQGTARRAAIVGYRVSGKTGTAWKASNGSYSTNRYIAIFGGVVPATRPRLAAVVVIDEPSAGAYYGGEVAAPVFSAVLSGALRLLAVPPDDLERIPPTTLVQAGDPW